MINSNREVAEAEAAVRENGADEEEAEEGETEIETETETTIDQTRRDTLSLLEHHLLLATLPTTLYTTRFLPATTQ
jgi:short subunit dehydrogenase-like uncharacterized protein